MNDVSSTQPHKSTQSNNSTQSKSNLSTLHHVAIQVDHIATAAQWYQEQFNCELSYLDESWALLRFANTSLALVLPNQHPPHLAVCVDNADQHGPLKTHRDGTRSLYIKDQDGNYVELMDTASLSNDDPSSD